MHMFMRIGMMQREAGGTESLELRADLGGEFAPRTRREEIAKAAGHLIGPEAPVSQGNGWQGRVAEDGLTIDEHQMQPDIE